MIRINTVLNKDNVNKIQFVVDGAPAQLNAISRMDLWIPEINLKIEDSTSTDFPLKWEHAPEETGILKLRLGNIQDLIDKYIITTTGNIENGVVTITNIPTADFSKLNKRMFVYGTGIGNSAQIRSIKHSTQTVTLNVPSTQTLTDTTIQFHDEIDNNVHIAKLYIYNVEYPNGLWWADLEVKVDISI